MASRYSQTALDQKYHERYKRQGAQVQQRHFPQPRAWCWRKGQEAAPQPWASVDKLNLYSDDRCLGHQTFHGLCLDARWAEGEQRS